MTFALSGKLINRGAGTTTVTDVDNGAIVGGIAVVATTGHGVWSYSLDGVNFSPIGTVSNNSAMLLPNTAQLCYTPDGSYSETVTLAYRAWDATAGIPETTADTTANGGTTAFSMATDTASLLVNDAPVLVPAAPAMGTTNEDTSTTINLAGTFINNGLGTTAITDPDGNAIVGGIALTGTTGRGTWSYSLDGTNFTSLGTVSDASAMLLPGAAILRYAPDLKNGETPTITYRAWDATSGTAGNKVDASRMEALRLLAPLSTRPRSR